MIHPPYPRGSHFLFHQDRHIVGWPLSPNSGTVLILLIGVRPTRETSSNHEKRAGSSTVRQPLEFVCSGIS
jgi:hypothetical protein